MEEQKMRNESVPVIVGGKEIDLRIESGGLCIDRVAHNQLASDAPAAIVLGTCDDRPLRDLPEPESVAHTLILHRHESCSACSGTGKVRPGAKFEICPECAGYGYFEYLCTYKFTVDVDIQKLDRDA